jgi:DNA uptake protein ComE-like DNA-binding protein
MMESNWRNFFEFSKHERIGVAIFLLLAGALLILPRFWYERYPPLAEEREWRNLMLQIPGDSDMNRIAESYPGANGSDADGKKKAIVLQPFDPHLQTEQSWVAMGIPIRTARIIVRYVQKGGRFRQAGDIRKIWGIREEDVQRLLPFVRLPQERVGRQELTERMGTNRNDLYQMEVRKQPIVIDINAADSASWAALPGIGAVLSRRIVRYREMRGGFQSLHDLRKVYGLSDSVYQLLVPFLRVSPAHALSTEITSVDTAFLNRASVRQLMIRLSLSYEVALAIVGFRQQYGSFRQVEDLRKIAFIHDSLYRQIMRVTDKR